MSTDLTRNASQATQIEQVRAAAEVAAAIQVAQQFRRTPAECLSEFLDSCSQKAFAERAFFRYARAGEPVTGVTINFAQEAARCWKNMQSGSIELERRATESDMIAFAWDVQNNTRRSSTFVNPHQGYTDTPKTNTDGTPKPPRKLVAVRDIRENNASAASRLEREMILGVLPTWYIEEAKTRCRETMAKDASGQPIEVRRQKMIDWFVDRLGVRRAQLEEKLGIAVDDWTAEDLATLGVIGKSISAGEVTRDVEFPASSGTKVIGSGEPPAGPVEAGEPAGEPLLKDAHKLRNEIFALLGQAGITGRGTDEKRRKIAAILLDHPVTSFTEITEAEGVQLRDIIKAWGGEGSDAIVAQMLEETEPGAEPTGEAPADASTAKEKGGSDE